VFILVGHHLHARFICEAIEGGKHVFVEKPLALNAEQLAKVEEMARRYPDLMVMVGFNRRFSPLNRYAKKLFGPINEPIVINYRINAGYIPKDSWIHDPEQGGGRIIGEVCHFVDLIQYFSDSLPESVYAESIRGHNGAMPDRDNVAITVKLRNGSVGSIIYVANGDKSYPKEKVEIFGQGSVAVIDNLKSVNFTKNGRTERKKNRFAMDKGHQDEMDALFRSIKEGHDFPVDFQEYVYTTLTTFKIEESIGSGSQMEIHLSELAEMQR